MKTVCVIFQSKDYASAQEEIDLDSCFDRFDYDLMKHLRIQVVKSSKDECDECVAESLIKAGLYSKHTALVDVVVTVRKIRKVLANKAA